MQNVLEKKKKNLTKERFQFELKQVRRKLPNHYGVIVRNLYPGTDIRKVYNVVNYGIHDEDILSKLKFIIPSEN